MGWALYVMHWEGELICFCSGDLTHGAGLEGVIAFFLHRGFGAHITRRRSLFLHCRINT